MAFTPGSRQAAAVGTAWVVVAACTALTIAFFTEIRAVAEGAIGRQEAIDTAVVTAPGPERIQLARPRAVELRAGAYGHFHVTAEVNGNPVRAMVDTGASMVALRFEDARDAGI